MSTELNYDNGRLTPYGFACGYIERKIDGDIETEIWMEHQHYHVRQHNHGDKNWGRVFWLTTIGLRSALARFNGCKGELN